MKKLKYFSPSLQPHQIGMTWQYTIEWHQPRDGNVDTDAQKASIDATKKNNNNNNNNNNRKNIVTVTSKPRSQMESSLITISTWTSSSSNSMMMMTNSSSSSRMEVDNSTMKVVEDKEEYRPLAVFVQVNIKTNFFYRSHKYSGHRSM
jgi:hypothetical protein